MRFVRATIAARSTSAADNWQSSVLADPEEVDADLVGKDALLDEVADRLRVRERAVVLVVGDVAEGVEPEDEWVRCGAHAASARTARSDSARCVANLLDAGVFLWGWWAKAPTGSVFFLGDYGEVESDSWPASSCSRSIRASSFARLSCRNSSALAASEVVSGPVGGRCPPGKRSRKARKRFMETRSAAG
jgi:hypothetical protein